jgi:hypothetical protein
MTDDDKALVNEARLDAKSFRENTIYTMDGVPARLIANANRLDQYADRIEAQAAEIEQLRKAGAKMSGYAGHDDDCQIMMKGVWGDKTPCDCGYEDAWKALRDALGENK